MSIPFTLPFGLGVDLSGEGIYTPSGFAYDFAIGGLPWLSAASKNNPIIRTTAPFRKQQFDSSNEPGEQSLDGWWLRSQQSFHGGAGQLYLDPGVDDSPLSSIRFFDSVGVDPWTPGTLQLLPTVEAYDPVVVDRMVSIPQTNHVFACSRDGADLYHINGTTDAVSTEPTPGSFAVDVAVDANTYYVADTDGIFSSEDFTGPWTEIWNLGVAQTNPVIAVVKERLVLAAGDGVYELAGTGPALPSPNWTPSGGVWLPVGIAEGPSAIYVAGHGAQGSIILRFTLDTSGVMPILTSGDVVAQFPVTEQIQSIFSYLGRYLAIGTTRGARIASISENGALEVGPLLWDGLEVKDWTSDGPFLYCSVFERDEHDLAPRDIYRVDLSTEISPLRFAYARDARLPDMEQTDLNPIRAVTMFKGISPIIEGAPVVPRALLVATIDGLVVTTPGTFVDEGYLQTSRIRFGTLEPKLFKLLRVRGPQTEADFFVSIIDTAGNEFDVVGYVDEQTPGLTDVAIPNLGPQDYVSLKFTLMSDADHDESALCSGYQLKVLPASPRKRLIQLPLWCFDREQDKNGNVIQGSAWERLEALEVLETDGDTVSLQDLNTGTVVSGVIEELRFEQTAPPAGFSGVGGIVTVTVRTV